MADAEIDMKPLDESDIRAPVYLIHDKVIFLPEEELLQLEPFERLEKCFALSPFWYQAQLEGIIEPVLIPSLKPAEYLLKWARLVYENNPVKDNVEEQMFRAKF